MGVTFRSVMIGLALIPLNCMWLALSEIMWYSGEPTTISLFGHVVFVIFLMVLGNLLLQRWRPAWALTGPEFLVIYSMLGIASALAGHDMIQILVPTLSHLHRYAPLENRYQEVLKVLEANVPSWYYVTDKTALEAAYLGQDSIYSWANVKPWLLPLGCWTLFIFALCAVMWGLVLLFRKQWTENEKLAYPIIQVPMLISEEPESLLRNKLFWSAFALAGFIDLINGLSVLYPLLPRIPVVQVTNLRILFTQLPRPRPWRSRAAG